MEVARLTYPSRHQCMERTDTLYLMVERIFSFWTWRQETFSGAYFAHRCVRLIRRITTTVFIVDTIPIERSKRGTNAGPFRPPISPKPRGKHRSNDETPRIHHLSVRTPKLVDSHPSGRRQEKTIVLLPWTRMRSSTCQATARASTARSVWRPIRRRSSTVSRWSTRCTSCSMIGPASSSLVT